MSKIRIILSGNDVIVNYESAPIVDTIFYVQVNGYCFPDNLWTDFTYPVLCMWAENLLRNKGRMNTQYDLPFMDGPFRIAVKQNGEALLMEGINGRADNRVEFTFRCTASELFHELLSAFNRLESIILTNENFRNQGIKEIVLNSIGHYKEAIENSLKSR